METTVKVLEKIKLRNPILVEGLPGIGNVGRVAAGYLVSELKMKKFAEIYSPHFLPLVILHDDSVAHLLKCELYYYRGKRDVVLLTGDTQSISPEGHYDFCDAILKFAQTAGIKEVITLGGFAEGQQVAEPRVIGAVNDKKLIKKYEKYGIDFSKNHSIGTIVGASGLLIGLASVYNIDAVCIMGETMGLPLMTDPKAADKVLHVISKILSIKVDLSKLENTIAELDEKIRKTDDIHKKMLSELSKPAKEDIRYIG